MAENVFICSDGHRLNYNIWLPHGKIKAFVQILHGMAEHSARYEAFALYLNSMGYAVYAHDHRGHGRTADDSERGWFAESDGWNRVCLDCFEIANYISDRYSAGYTFLLGHSMGSLLARTVMSDNPYFYVGVILMGTATPGRLAVRIGRMIASWQVKRHGQKSEGTLLNMLCFGSYNRAFRPNLTEFDWLSTDVQTIALYLRDPMCGFVCTNGFFADLLGGIEYVNSEKRAAGLPSDLPLLIVSGKDDPAGNMGNGVRRVYSMYRNAGIKDVTLKLFDGMRHEILNEIDRQSVYEYIATWLDSRL